jgi:uncharacterized membrane protein YbhN (UPF0104 family)
MNEHRAAPRRRAGRRQSVRRWSRRGLMVALLAGCGLLIFLAPLAVGTRWADLVNALAAIDPRWWPVLTVVWLAGLCCYAAVMTASLPGLSGRQALGLNLAGSAVANSLPLGGGVSLALTTTMMRSWGFTPSAVTSFLVLTNVWNVVSRLLIGGLAAGWLLIIGSGGGVGVPVLIVGAALVIAVLSLLALLISDPVVAWTGQTATGLEQAFRSRFQPSTRRPADRDLAAVLVALRQRIAALLHGSWPRLTVGMAGYFGLLAVLLDLCLRGLGTAPSPFLILAAVGIERLVTALPITPGGAGAAELSLVACLTAGGIPGVQALAAALLYRIFTFFAEIPLGAVVALVWYLDRDRAGRGPSAALGVPQIERAG